MSVVVDLSTIEPHIFNDTPFPSNLSDQKLDID
jgi:hypothetical protein